MRNTKHWTLPYLIDRTIEAYYRVKNSDSPWLTPDSIKILDSLLLKTDIGFEYGSGRSTIWLAKRVQKLLSVEHNIKWYEYVSKEINKCQLENVEYHHIQKQETLNLEFMERYVKTINLCTGYDFVLIDGILRDHCTKTAIDKLKSGGILIIDNVNWYLPSNSKSPSSINSDGVPASELWGEVKNELKLWRNIWTTNGVTDTAIYFKPFKIK